MEINDPRRNIFNILANNASGCTSCGLCESRTNIVFGSGDPNSEIVFLGEGPGKDEDFQGLPFVGRSGKLLTKMIEAMGYRRDDVYILNIVKCRPPNNRKPEKAEMAACKPYLDMQLEVIKPKIIVALGSTAVEGLLGPGLGITKRRGKIEYIEVGGRRVAVMPTYHPAFCLRNPPAKIEVHQDLTQVVKYLKGE